MPGSFSLWMHYDDWMLLHLNNTNQINLRLPSGGLFYCHKPDGEWCNGRMTSKRYKHETEDSRSERQTVCGS
jgi:hypothetical protein